MKTNLLLVLLAALFAVGSVAQGDLVTRTIQHENDDAEEYLSDYYSTASYALGAGWLVSSDLELGHEWVPECWTGIGLQYDQLGIPAESLILSAKLTFTVDEAQGTSVSNDFTIFGEATGDASPFNYIDASYRPIVPFDITSRDRTYASVGWSPTDPAVGSTIDTPDIAAVIQDIVIQGGWSDNNRLTLMIFPDAYLNSANPSTGITRHTYEAGPGTDSATLTIEWTEFDGATNPSPANGEQIYPANPLTLSWTNATPDVGDSVWVDVWFGTDPNDSENFNKIVDAGENTNSTTVDASVPGVYCWKVNSYIYGDPATVLYDMSGTDPNGFPVIEGFLWRFYVIDDFPVESVEAGDDMITWSGEPVDLDATVVDDGQSDLTIAWTANTAPGITTEFSDPSIEDPTVTITKADSYSAAGIVNAGFEDPVLDDGVWSYSMGNQGWGYFANDGYLGSWNPGTKGSGSYDGIAPEGQNIGWACPIGVPGGFAQVLSETIEANTTYTLTVEVGNTAAYEWGGYKVQILAGGTPHDTTSTNYTGPVVGGDLCAEDDNSMTIAEETFETSTVVYTSGPDVVADPNIGLPLQIRLLAIGLNSSYEVEFDDVRLTAVPPFPAPEVSTVELTLAASDEANPTPVEDTMTIDVYDDACAASRIGLSLAAENPGDVDADCDVDIADLALIAEKWLSDTGLTEAVPKQ